MKKLVSALVLTGLVGVPAVAKAAEEGPHSFSANVGIASDYRFRGVSQTFKQPAIQGGFDYEHKSGVYLGTWASNVQEEFLNGANIEMDFYGGYSTEIMPDVTIDVGGLYYYYPGQNSGTTKINTFELYGGVTWKWFNVKYSHATTKLFGVDGSRNSWYLEGNVSIPLPMDVTLDLHYGHQEIKGAGNEDFGDWKIAVSKPIGGFDFSLAYIDTDISGGGAFTRASDGKTKKLANGTAVLTISKSF